MAGERFETAFDRLLRAWRAHQEASRDIDALPALARARIELDDARDAVAVARPPLPSPPPRRPTDEERTAYWRRRALAAHAVTA